MLKAEHYYPIFSLDLSEMHSDHIQIRLSPMTFPQNFTVGKQAKEHGTQIK
jgi:hypothetical protein